MDVTWSERGCHVRVIAGRQRGRRLRVPRGLRVRPTLSKIVATPQLGAKPSAHHGRSEAETSVDARKPGVPGDPLDAQRPLDRDPFAAWRHRS